RRPRVPRTRNSASRLRIVVAVVDETGLEQRRNLVPRNPVGFQPLAQRREQTLDRAVQALLIAVQPAGDVSDRHRVLEPHPQNQTILRLERLARAVERRSYATREKALFGADDLLVGRRTVARDLVRLALRHDLV